MKLKTFLGCFSILIFSSCSMFQSHHGKRTPQSVISENGTSIEINVRHRNILVTEDHIKDLLMKFKRRGKSLTSVNDIVINQSFAGKAFEFNETYNPGIILLNKATKNPIRLYYYKLTFSTPDLEAPVKCGLLVRVDFKRANINGDYSSLSARDCYSAHINFKDDYIRASFSQLGIAGKESAVVEEF
ncbi:MAG: hypothetical protein OXB88_06790 [Bacteriovoracales bacterium]|nr:hypothetical protein [Bacteriovoracales bacterium]